MAWVKVLNAEQMRAVDRQTIDGFGVSGAELMERAGRRLYESVIGRWQEIAALEAVVACGKGNNGGDGYVVARLLHQAGADVRVFLTAELSSVGGDARRHLDLLRQAGVEVEALTADLEGFESALAGADLAIDALLGNGARGEPRGVVAAVIGVLNRCAVPVMAVDLPSGVDADSGAAAAQSVDAAWTVTFGQPQPGHFFYPGRARCGSLELVDIGFPPEVVGASESVALLIDEETAAQLVPRRDGDAHKGSCGSVGLVAGSRGMSGAAALATEAALRAGAGKAFAAVPASLHDILETKISESMTLALPEVGRRGCLALRGAGEIRRLAATVDSLVLGPGLGRYRETTELVRRLLPQLALPLVLDADGINALEGDAALLRQVKAPVVLTPHRGEFARLSGLSRDEIAADPLGVVRRFVEEHRVTLVLKGAPTVIGRSDGQVLINPSGNAGMATAGSGDVLAGLVAGLVAQGLDVDAAACLGVYIHGCAGDRARDRLGEWGMLAGDLCAEVPMALAETARTRRRPG